MDITYSKSNIERVDKQLVSFRERCVTLARAAAKETTKQCNIVRFNSDKM